MRDRCLHPIVIDVNVARVFFDPEWWRKCALCEFGYNRSTRVLDPLREKIRAKHRLPKSPWTAAERSADC